MTTHRSYPRRGFRIQSMELADGIVEGASLEAALECFRRSVNLPDTIFSTEQWLAPKITELTTLLHDPITGDQALALCDVLYQRRWMRDLLEWLQSPPMPWSEFFEYRDRRESDSSWKQLWQEWAAANAKGVPACPKCRSAAVVAIRYGYPSPEMLEGSRNGEFVLGGCCLSIDMPFWFCRDCRHSFRGSSA